MKSASYASWRAASPPEVSGEPDDDGPPRRPDPEPVTYSVEWYPLETLADGTVERVRCVRHFDGTSHGSEALAFRAASRWHRVVVRFHGPDNVAFMIEGG